MFTLQLLSPKKHRCQLSDRFSELKNGDADDDADADDDDDDDDDDGNMKLYFSPTSKDKKSNKHTKH